MLRGGCLPGVRVSAQEGVCLEGGVCLGVGICLLPGGCLHSAWGGVHLAPRQTDTCENITFPQLLLRTVIIVFVANATLSQATYVSLRISIPYVQKE